MKMNSEEVIVERCSIDYIPKVSVIIPVYNAEATIERCIKSILSQSLKEIEVICVDDGSTDKSIDILKNIRLNDNRITIISQKNKFAGVARNVGINNSKGEYLSFIDADDWIIDGSLERLYNLSKDNDVEMLKTSCVYFDDKNKNIYSDNWISLKNIGTDNFNKLLNYNTCSKLLYLTDAPWSGLYNRNFVLNNNIIFDDLKCANDSCFFIKCLVLASRIYVADVVYNVYVVNQERSLITERYLNFDCQISLFKNVCNFINKNYTPHKSEILKLFIDAIFTKYEQYINSDIPSSNKHKIILMIDHFMEEIKSTIDNDFYIELQKLNRKIQEKSNALVSVIIPIYNTDKYLSDCLDSIIQQTYSNLEIICVNDGSTDRTSEILDKYRSKDSRIIVINQENKGQAAARNKGVRCAKGGFLYFCDSDDWIEKNCIENFYKSIIEHDCDVVLSGMKLYDEKNEKYLDNNWCSASAYISFNKSFSYKDIRKEVFSKYETPCKFYRKQFFIDNDLFFHEGHYYEDVLVSIKTKLLANSIGYVEEDGYTYRMNRNGSTMTEMSKSKVDDVFVFLRDVDDFLVNSSFYDELKYEYYNFINGQLLFHLKRMSDNFRYYFAIRAVDFINERLEVEYIVSNFSNPIYSLINTPLVSVIIPVFNVENYLEKTLKSVINQTYLNLEVICIDDGSTDKSKDIIEKFSVMDARIKCFYQTRKGVSAARNVGLDNSSGDFVYCLDSDDWLDVATIEDLLRPLLRDETIGFSTSNVQNIAESKDVEKIAVDGQKWFDNYKRQTGCYSLPLDVKSIISSTCWNKLFRKSIIDAFNIRFIEGLINEDEAWLWQYTIHCKKYYYLDVLHYYYLRRNSSIMSGRENRKSFLDIVDIHVRIVDYIKKYKDITNYYEILANHFIIQTKYVVNNCRAEYLDELQTKIRDYKDNCNNSALLENYYKWVNETVKKRTRKELYIPNNPLVSVIVPTYNNGIYLCECIDSLISQTIKNIEIIVINDGSTDNTYQILEDYSRKDSRIKIIQQNNLGQGAARNKGISIAKGKYIQFVDSDDYIVSDACDRIVDVFENNNSDMVFIQGQNFDNLTRNKLPCPQYKLKCFPVAWEKSNCFSYSDCISFISELSTATCMTCYSLSFVKENNISFAEGLYFEDNIFFAKSLFKAKRISLLRYDVYYRRIHEKSVTQNWDIHFSDFLKVIDILLTWIIGNELDETIVSIYKHTYIYGAIWRFNTFTDEFKRKYCNELVSLCKKYNYSIDGINYDCFSSFGVTTYRNLTKFNLFNLTVFSQKIDSITSYNRIRLLGMNIYKKYSYDNVKYMAIIGIPIYKIQNKTQYKKVNILGIQFYKRELSQNKKRIFILGLPISSHKTEGYIEKRRFLCFKHKTVNTVRQINDLMTIVNNNGAMLNTRINSVENIVNQTKMDLQQELLENFSQQNIINQKLDSNFGLLSNNVEQSKEALKSLIEGVAFECKELLAKLDELKTIASQNNIELANQLENCFIQNDTDRACIVSKVDLLHTSLDELKTVASQNNIELANQLADLSRFMKVNYDIVNPTLNELSAQLTNIQSEKKLLISSIKSDFNELQSKINDIPCSINKLATASLDNMKTNLALLQSMNDKVSLVNDNIIEAKKVSQEVEWGVIFNNTITGSSWLKHKNFNPGRWAIGYPALYVLYRILNELKPNSILELGLGQSTKMVAQYSESRNDITHYVVEHDDNWISLFKKNFNSLTHTNLVKLSWDYVTYNDVENVRVYHNFKEKFKDEKFTLILVDGPLGGDMTVYARIDILSIIPHSLNDEFVIVVDDTNRITETNMVKEIEKILKLYHIEFAKGEYQGIKKTTVICSKALRFLTSM